MKSRNLLALGLFGVTALALTACGPTGPSSFTLDGAKANADFNGLRVAGHYDCEANQMGDVRALIVPVEFTDYSADELPLGREGTKEAFNTLMFGDPETDQDLMWESLASFYDKSSYGMLNITGQVVDWWNTGMNTRAFAKGGGVPDLVGKVNEYYRNGEGANIINVDDFDANDDGYIDLTIFIYSCPQRTNGDSDTFWAYTTQYSAFGASGDAANISRYIWASVDFMYEGGYYDDAGNFHEWTPADKTSGRATLDAHTFIHEVGHGLGLADYYSYDYNGDSPMGGPDMMDNNVGDNNAYSKTLMGWINPTVVTNTSTYTLRSFELTGDALIVPIRGVVESSENFEESFTILSEYLMVQFDTPDGLATMDSQHQYSGAYPLFYNEPGVRILHVDSRMGIFSLQDGSFQQYSNTYKLSSTVAQSYYVDFAHDNTATRSVNDIRLIQLVVPDATSANGGKANLDAVTNNPSEKMWMEGQKLTNWEMNTFIPNDPSGSTYELGFSISIDSIDAVEKTCTVTITAA